MQIKTDLSVTNYNRMFDHISDINGNAHNISTNQIIKFIRCKFGS